MKYLLDTSVLIHSIIAQTKLSAEALALLADPASDLYLSPVSSWEMVVKVGTGKLALPERPSQVVARATRLMSLESLDVTHAHALAVDELPRHHRDPFDRMLIAQACQEQMVLLTVDRIFAKYQVEQIFCAK